MARIHRRTIKKKKKQKKKTKKDIHDPDNHDDMIKNPEPDILGCEAKLALGSITMNKASGVMEFQWSYSKS